MLKIEEAYQDNVLIGYRLSAGGSTLLVWADQSIMQGFRVGYDFTPDFDKIVVYKEVTIGERTRVCHEPFVLTPEELADVDPNDHIDLDTIRAHRPKW